MFNMQVIILIIILFFCHIPRFYIQNWNFKKQFDQGEKIKIYA